MTTNDSNNDASNSMLMDLTDSGAAVPKRVSTAAQAQSICSRFIMDDTIRAQRRLLVQGKFCGNAPKSLAAMAIAKRENDSNLNWKQHRGLIMNAWTPFFDLVCEVPVCIDGDLELNGGDAALNEELMRGFAEYFHDMVFGWRDFDNMNQLCDLQMLLHGVGMLAWQDEWNWRPAPILASNFYVPDETQASFDNAEMCMLTQPISAGQLYRKIMDDKEAKARGWNPEAVKAVIMDSGNSDAIQAYGKIWDRWQQAFKNGDLYVSQQQTKQIQLATIYVQEMDGTISQMIVPQRPGGSTNGDTGNTHGSGKVDFLYYAQSRYDNWDQVVCAFPYDIGADGTFHSVKGLGTDIFPFCELLDKVQNTLADLAVSSIKPMWQPTTGGDIEKFQMAKWGGGNMIPQGIAPLDIKIGTNLGPALEISREFSSILSQNTGAYNQQELAAPTVEETAKSAMIRAAERSKLTKGSYNRYMRSKDRQYAEMFRRASNPLLRDYHPDSAAALKFQRKCQALCSKMQVEWLQSVDALHSPTGKAGKFTVLELVQNVRANRTLGLGSAAMRIEIANQLMQNIDRFDEIGQNEIKRMFVATMTSFQAVDAIVPSLTTGRENVDDQSDAAQEDNGFTILGPDAEAYVVPGQNHVIHLSVHIPSMQKDQSDCEQGAVDPRECAKRLEGKAPHAYQHLEVLKTNPTKQMEYKQFMAAFQQIASFQDHLQQMIEEQNNAQAQEPPPGQPDPKLVQVQGNLQLKSQKDQGNHELKMQNQQFNQELKMQQAQFDAQLAAQKAAYEQRIKDLETASGIHRENAVAVSSVAIKARTNGNLTSKT